MRLITTTNLATAALALALALPVAALAQTNNTTTTPTTTASPTTMNDNMSSEAVRKRVEQHIADMYATLKITPAQEKQWNQFAQVMLDNAQSVHMLVSKHQADMSTANAEQLLQDYAALAQQHAENVQKLLPAFRTLYASLSPEQKKEADEMFRARAEEHEQNRQGAMQNEQKPGMTGTQKQGG